MSLGEGKIVVASVEETRVVRHGGGDCRVIHRRQVDGTKQFSSLVQRWRIISSHWWRQRELFVIVVSVKKARPASVASRMTIDIFVVLVTTVEMLRRRHSHAGPRRTLLVEPPLFVRLTSLMPILARSSYNLLYP